ncbi:MAG: MMPL family transporter [Actinomycetota bacterium]|nr:MMPL family transporter [Actinomycetota bacterium]MDQ3636631.1 MMPL family transporter [Actinomycetota bacterium]
MRGPFGYFGLVLVRLRWVIVLFWTAAAVWAYVYLPPLDERLTGGMSELAPEAASPASRPAALAPPGARPPAPASEEPASPPEETGSPDPAAQGRAQVPPSVLGSVEAQAVLVYSDPGGIGPGERGIIEEDLEYLNGPYGPHRLELAVPLAVPGALAVPEVAAEQEVLPVLLFFEPDTSGTGIREGVEQVRRTLGEGPVRAEVTGIGPVQEDTIAVVKGSLGKVTLATALVIFSILAFAYRSPLAPLVPLASIGLATFLTLRLVAFFALERGTPVPSQVEPVIIVLLFGVGTDYALFLLSRTRQALREGASRHEAARSGVERVGGVIFSSAAVLVASFAVLVRADLTIYKVLGPGLGLALLVLTLVTLTLVPALLAILGRAVFGGAGDAEPRQSYGLVTRRPGLVAGILGFVLLLGALGAVGLKVGFDQVDTLPDDAPAARGYETLQRGFPAGILSPVNVVLEGEGLGGQVEELRRLESELWGSGGFAAVLGPQSAGLLPRVPFVTPDGDGVRFLLVFYGNPYSPESLDQIGRLKEDLPNMLGRAGLEGVEADVGGQAVLAEAARSLSGTDLARLAPLVLAVAFVVLALLLRTPVAPLYLLGATVLSFAATLGVTKLLFQTILGQGGVAFYVPFTLFILLVALGSDYNIFIMAAIREEARKKPLPEAVAAALAGTNRTINAAGLALASSFALLVLIPLQDFLQLGLTVALGILLDAFVIRTLLVPALVLLVGRLSFWPAKVRA